MGVLWGGGMGEQRASFRVDRSGGLYQNNTFVDYRTKRRSDKERTRFEREYLRRLASCCERAVHAYLFVKCKHQQKKVFLRIKIKSGNQ